MALSLYMEICCLHMCKNKHSIVNSRYLSQFSLRKHERKIFCAVLWPDTQSMAQNASRPCKPEKFDILTTCLAGGRPVDKVNQRAEADAKRIGFGFILY